MGGVVVDVGVDVVVEVGAGVVMELVVRCRSEK